MSQQLGVQVLHCAAFLIKIGTWKHLLKLMEYARASAGPLMIRSLSWIITIVIIIIYCVECIGNVHEQVPPFSLVQAAYRHPKLHRFLGGSSDIEYYGHLGHLSCHNLVPLMFGLQLTVPDSFAVSMSASLSTATNPGSCRVIVKKRLKKT